MHRVPTAQDGNGLGMGVGDNFQGDSGLCLSFSYFETFPKEVKPESAITLRTLIGRTEGTMGTQKVLECGISPFCASG